MKYRLLCVDIDGTLARSDKSIPEENKKALYEAYRAGIRIAAASGRPAASLGSIMEEIGIPKTMICLNGAYVEAEGKQVMCNYFSREQLETAYRIIQKFQTKAVFNAPLFSIRNSDVSPQWKKQIKEGSLKADYIVAKDPDEYERLIFCHQDEIVKISILETNSQRYEQIRNAFVSTGLFSVAKSDVDYVDISDKKSTKGNGVSSLAHYLQIPLSEVVSIGDNENDYDMLKVSGLSVAMGNAAPEIKKIADRTTDDNEHCGVAKAVKQLLSDGRGEYGKNS